MFPQTFQEMKVVTRSPPAPTSSPSQHKSSKEPSRIEFGLESVEGKRSPARREGGRGGGGRLGPRLASLPGAQGGGGGSGEQGEQGGWACTSAASHRPSWAAPAASHAVKSVFRVNPRWEESLSLSTSVLRPGDLRGPVAIAQAQASPLPCPFARGWGGDPEPS